MAVGLDEIVAALSRETGDAEGFNPTRIPGLFVMRSSIETRPQCMLYSPALCLIVQGEKEMLVGETRTVFREGQSLITTKDVPTLVHINKASRDYPFLGLGLELNVTEIRGVMEYLSNPLGSASETGFELFVEDTSKQLEDCVIRLFDASHRPNALAILHPSIMREVYYWLLTGPNGAKITRQIGNSGVSQRISKVIHRLKETFRQPLKVDQLAQIANMSPSSFFHHFKTITSMTPVQFQKNLRLLEGRHLLVMAGISVAEAASRVGYESTSQFSREYSRMFGLPPGRDTSYFYSVAAPGAA